jgi:hypothetical protein
VQLNGNQKPAYLFDEVPYVKEGSKEVSAFQQVGNRQGTLMYWHPAHERAYVNLLVAFRDHLAASRYKKSIIGLRMNFNPFGTEGVNLYPQQALDEYSKKDRWIQPPGLDKSIAYEGYNKKDALDYVRRIIRKHLELFKGVVPMFIRGTVDHDVLMEFSDSLENGTFGCFETGSSFAPFSPKPEITQAWILKYAKSGRTVGYAESISDSWGFHGFMDETWLPPPQAFYWRVLCDLHKGVSYIACYGKDLNIALTGTYKVSAKTAAGKPVNIDYSDSRSGFNYKHEYSESLAWAAKYAGYHASPEQAPGAWIALRGDDKFADARITNQKLTLPEFTGDYTYLMDRLPDKSVGVTHVGPEQIRFGGYARQLPANGALRVNTDVRFIKSLKSPCKLGVIYFDDTPGASFTMTASGQTWTVLLHGSKSWEEAMFDVTAPAFTKNAGGGHVVIQSGTTPLNLHMILIERK